MSYAIGGNRIQNDPNILVVLRNKAAMTACQGHQGFNVRLEHCAVSSNVNAINIYRVSHQVPDRRLDLTIVELRIEQWIIGLVYYPIHPTQIRRVNNNATWQQI
ncbi:MAG: hypothetical protein V5B38_05735 [Candidatus Accumulibacter propinquus]